MAAVATRARCDFDITVRVFHAVNAHSVFVELVNGQSGIIHAHEGSISVTLRARLRNIERIDGRPRFFHRDDAMRIVAGGTLRNVLFSRRGEFSMDTRRKHLQLVSRQGRIELLHHDGCIGMTSRARVGNAVSFGHTDESLFGCHGLLHLLGQRIAPVTASARNPLLEVDITSK